MSASSIALPDLPRMFVATQSSLIPVSSSALCSDAVGGEPVAQGEQPGDRGRELGDVLGAAAAFFRRARAGSHLRLVDVKPRGALDDRLHLSLLERDRRESSPRDL